MYPFLHLGSATTTLQVMQGRRVMKYVARCFAAAAACLFDMLCTNVACTYVGTTTLEGVVMLDATTRVQETWAATTPGLTTVEITTMAATMLATVWMALT